MANGYLSETFQTTQTNNALFNEQEQPSDQMKVKILLKKSVSSVLNDLNRRFTTTDMKASPDKNNTSAIVVTGIPPYDGYGPQNILTVVKSLDGGARIIQ